MTNSPRIPLVHRVLVVRHAPSRVDEHTPANQWGLSDAGHAAARRLASLAIFDYATGYYAGAEPKMLETLAPVAGEHGLPVHTEPALAESASAGWLSGTRFLGTIHRFFEAPDAPPAPGWEPARQAAARFSARIDELRALHAPPVNRDRVLPGTFAVTSGGRAIIAYLTSLLGYTPAQALSAWQALKMPDVAVLELSATAPPRIIIPFGILVV